MQVINDILYIEYADLLACDFSAEAIKKANFRNGPYWQMIRNPLDQRMPFVQYDTLRQQHKDKIIAKYGNPFEYVALFPIKALYLTDPQAELYYRNYRFEHGKILPLDNQERYTTAASWLNVITKCVEDKAYIKKTLGLSLDAFWTAIAQIISTDKIALPASYRNLLAKHKQYTEQGYECLISGKFGNKDAAKIGKGEAGFDADIYDKQMALIRKAASKHNNYDAQQICSFVNTIFEKQNWATVSRTTVYNIMQEQQHLTTAGSRGKREYKSNVAMQHKRSAPTSPLLYFTLDGWTAELLYQKDGTYHNRLVVVVVLDAFTKYPVGYAIGDRENVELIKQANRNAIEHIEQLFGDKYHAHQIQSDNYGLKALTPFYSAMAKMHTPAAVGNAKAKIIEPYFNTLNKTYAQRFPNWSGYNLNSKKTNQPNREYLDATKSTFPDRKGVEKQIEMIIAQERKIKVDTYVAGWDNAPYKNVMTKEDVLITFGRPHTHTNSIEGKGLQIAIEGERITYDSFNPAFRNLLNEKFQVIVDPANTDNVLAITEDGRRRFLLERKRIVPMDVYSTTDEDRAYTKQINDYNKQAEQRIMDTYAADDALVAEVMDNTTLALDDFDEAAIKLMFTTKGQQKEALQDAKGLGKVQKKIQRADRKQEQAATDHWQQMQEQYLAEKTDLSKYED